ncbi:hypothetical protein QBC34DRAFT_334442 [Podospora aff. communis PSN243]|uniref:Peptidase S8/S53 domain-containing protein n=1 Tax=Podospora aff. communis PSN243 TaxID=3040156 RepID=A0AAV9G9G6_9PEZI|nr:hypothetical protein QBC34DRAFT_334442 [Podospora aff. communis PSN243]
MIQQLQLRAKPVTVPDVQVEGHCAPQDHLILSGGMTPDARDASSPDLAKDSAQKMAVIAATLSTKETKNMSRNPVIIPRIKMMGELAGNLQCASFVLDKHDGRGLQEPVESLLLVLNRLCTYEWSPQRLSDFSSLLKEPSPHPILKLLQQDTPGAESGLVVMIQHSLKRYVARRVERPKDDEQELDPLTFLMKFASPASQPDTVSHRGQTGLPVQQPKDIETPADLPPHVHKEFYRILKELWSPQCSCCNATSNGSSPAARHHGRLKLKQNFEVIEKYVLFDTVFSKHAKQLESPAEQTEWHWQHLQFQIPLRQTKVGFSDPPASPLEAVPSGPIISSTTEFYQLLRKPVGPAKICLQAAGIGVCEGLNPAPLDDDIAPEQSTSLAQVIQNHNLAAKQRLILAYILARSFWQFYDSDFMSVRWTATTIQFFRERQDDDDDEDSCLLHESPYFALSFSQADVPQLSSEYLPTESVVHRYPRLLALGRLILDLGRRRHRGSDQGCREETFQERISTDLNDMLRALKRKTWPKLDLQDEARQTYRLVLENCSNPKLFETVQSEQRVEIKETLTIEERRAIIYSRIVYPLKSLLEKVGWLDKSGSFPPEGIVDDGKPNPDRISATEKASLLSDSDSASASRLKAQQWLERIQVSDVTIALVKGFRENPILERIRVAVIDTGYDPASTFLRDPSRRRRIQGWKDFVTDHSPTGQDEVRQDEDGHGTYVLSLLMKVIPAADFYVIRVARGTADLPESSGNVAKAITHAAEDFGVDIISMSFGFGTEVLVNGQRAISNAISHALQTRDQKILFFAAAANSGGNQPEMFPASHPQVISIRGTDDKGWLQRYNPPPGYDSSNCFMTLGQDVPGAGLSRGGGGEVVKSGTSVSTPIAAGIAGMLLSYARLFEQDLKEFEGRCGTRRERLATMQGMRGLFRKLSTEMLDKWYYLSAEPFLDLESDRDRAAWLMLPSR